MAMARIMKPVNLRSVCGARLLNSFFKDYVVQVPILLSNVDHEFSFVYVKLNMWKIYYFKIFKSSAEALVYSNIFMFICELNSLAPDKR